MLERVNIALVGYGYWGEKVLKALMSLHHIPCQVKYICDVNFDRLKPLTSPSIEKTKEIDQVLKKDDIDLLFVLTEPINHFAHTKRALESGKNVFVEKPICLDPNDYRELKLLAKSQQRSLYTSHIYLYSQGFHLVQKTLLEKAIGEIVSYESYRHNFGREYPETTVVHDLLYHDLYILESLCPGALKTQDKPQVVPQFYREKSLMMCAVSMSDMEGVNYYLSCSNFSPRKRRETIITGSEGIIVWDDVEKSVELLKFFSLQKNDATSQEIVLERVFKKYYTGEDTLSVMLSTLLSNEENEKLSEETIALVLKKMSEVNSIVESFVCA